MYSEHAVPLPTGVTLFTSVGPGPADQALLVIHGGPDWADTTLSGPALTRAAAVARAPADVWRPEARPGYLRRLSLVHFTAEWLRPHRAGILPSPRPADPVADLSAAGRPVLLLQGEHDMTFPAFLAGQAASRVPRASAVVLADAGHMAHVDDPHGWLGALRRFLAL